MVTDRNSIKVVNQLYKDMKARFPVLRVVLDIILLSIIITFIGCNGSIKADKSVLLVLDIVFGIIAFLIAICLYATVQDFLRKRNFYATTEAENEYEFFADGFGIYQRRNGRLIASEITYYNMLSKSTENKTYFNLFRNDYESYPVCKKDLTEDELIAIRRALGLPCKLPHNSKKIELPRVELAIPPYVAITLKEEE